MPGGQYVAQALNLPTRIAEADLVLTGEGRFDEQSLTGKVVGTLADMTSPPTLGIIAGSATASAPQGTLLEELDGEEEGDVAQRLSNAAERLVRSVLQS